MKSAFISDGYNLTGTVLEGEQWPEFTFLFRPATAAEIREHKRHLSASSDEKQTSVIAEFVAAHLLSWTLPEEHTAAVLPKLHGHVWAALYNAVCGYEGELVTITEGADEGNSPTG